MRDRGYPHCHHRHGTSINLRTSIRYLFYSLPSSITLFDPLLVHPYLFITFMKRKRIKAFDPSSNKRVSRTVTSSSNQNVKTHRSRLHENGQAEVSSLSNKRLLLGMQLAKQANAPAVHAKKSMTHPSTIERESNTLSLSVSTSETESFSPLPKRKGKSTSSKRPLRPLQAATLLIEAVDRPPDLVFPTRRHFLAHRDAQTPKPNQWVSDLLQERQAAQQAYAQLKVRRQ